MWSSTATITTCFLDFDADVLAGPNEGIFLFSTIKRSVQNTSKYLLPEEGPSVAGNGYVMVRIS